MNMIDRINMMHYMVYLQSQTIENGYIRAIISTELSDKSNIGNAYIPPLYRNIPISREKKNRIMQRLEW